MSLQNWERVKFPIHASATKASRLQGKDGEDQAETSFHMRMAEPLRMLSVSNFSRFLRGMIRNPHPESSLFHEATAL